MKKIDLMKAVYTEEELKNVDSSIPIELWKECIGGPRFYVMDYNVHTVFGKLTDLREREVKDGKR